MQYKLNIRSIEYSSILNGMEFHSQNFIITITFCIFKCTNIPNPLATKKKKIKDFKIFLLTKVYPEFR